jgi:hypothetical protein
MLKLHQSRSAKLLHVLLQVARDRNASQERVLETILCIKYIQKKCQCSSDGGKIRLEKSSYQKLCRTYLLCGSEVSSLTQDLL